MKDEGGRMKKKYHEDTRDFGSLISDCGWDRVVCFWAVMRAGSGKRFTTKTQSHKEVCPLHRILSIASILSNMWGQISLLRP